MSVRTPALPTVTGAVAGSSFGYLAVPTPYFFVGAFLSMVRSSPAVVFTPTLPSTLDLSAARMRQRAG